MDPSAVAFQWGKEVWREGNNNNDSNNNKKGRRKKRVNKREAQSFLNKERGRRREVGRIKQIDERNIHKSERPPLKRGKVKERKRGKRTRSFAIVHKRE